MFRILSTLAALLVGQWALSSVGRFLWISGDASVALSWGHGSIGIYQADNRSSFIQHTHTGLDFKWQPALSLQPRITCIYPGRVNLDISLAWLIAWLVMLAAILRSLDHLPRAAGVCQNCGYNTRGGVTHTCSECGWPQAAIRIELQQRSRRAKLLQWLGWSAIATLTITVFGWAAWVGTMHVVPDWTAPWLAILVVPTAYTGWLHRRLSRAALSQPPGPASKTRECR